MKKLFKTLFAFVLVAASALILTFTSTAAEGKWIAAWGTGPTQLRIPAISEIIGLFGPVTTRSVITPTATGSKVRFLVSNRFGSEDITIEAMYVARSTGASKINVDSSSPVTFDGRAKVVIPAGEERYSDAINFSVSAFSMLSLPVFASAPTSLLSSAGTSFIPRKI